MIGMGTASATSATPAPSPTVLNGSRPAWADNAPDLGPVNGSTPVDFAVLLNLSNPSAAASGAMAVSTPGSSTYHDFISASQFDAEYGPSVAEIQSVVAWLRAAGLQVSSLGGSHLLVEATGTAAQAESLVGTQLDVYRYDGKDLLAPVSDYQIPASVAGAVDGIVGLDDTSMLIHPAATEPGPPPGERFGVEPCSAYYGQKEAKQFPEAYGQHWPYTVCGYDADQLEQAYGLYPGIQNGTADGQGVTVDIVDAYSSPTMLSDADTWSQQNDLPEFGSGQYVQTTPPPDGYDLVSECGAQGWYGEETLDVESVHAMAPDADIHYYGARDCNYGLDASWALAIMQHKADVITDSWTFTGEDVPPAYIDFYTDFLELAAYEGVTVQFSSGDDGDNVAATGTKSVNFPASDPFATGVGGTTTEIGSDGQMVFQNGWENAYSDFSLKKDSWEPAPPGTYSSGSGGGTSLVFRQPAYQAGHVPTSISEYYGPTPMRAVPDIAMPADPNTGLRIGETQVFPTGTYYATYRLGGTSLASPLLAGVIADADQYNGSSAGFINPAIYAGEGSAGIDDVLAPSSPTATVRTDFRNYLNAKDGYHFELQTIDYQGTTIHTLPGYDDETGVGTPSGPAFFSVLAGNPASST